MIKIDFFKLTPRLGRIEHLGLFSFWWSVMVIGFYLDKIIPNHSDITIIPTVLLITIGVINIMFIKIRRLNDFDCSGWWILVGLIPLFGPLWILAIFWIPGTDGNNRFGNPPGDPSDSRFLLILAAPLILYLINILWGLD